MAVGTAGFSRGNFTAGFGRRRRAAPFNPGAFGTVSFWYRAEGANVTPAFPADGAVVTAVNDKGAANNDGTASGTDGPTYQAGEVAGKDCLRFDASNDVVTTGVSCTDSYTVVVVCKVAAGNGVVVDVDSGFRCYLGANYGGGVRLFINGSDSANVGSGPGAGAWAVVWGSLATTACKAGYEYPLGSASASGSGTPSGAANFRVGNAANADVAEVVVYQPALSDADRAAVVSGLAGNYGLQDQTADLMFDPTITPASTTTYNPATRSDTGGTRLCYKALAAAISAVQTGGTVNVREGTHFLPAGGGGTCLTVNAKQVRLYSYDGEERATLTYDAADPPVVESGAGSGHLITVNGTGAGLHLVGLRLVGLLGRGMPYGLGNVTDQSATISHNTAGHLRIDRCWFYQFNHGNIKHGMAVTAASWIRECGFCGGGYSQRDHHLYPNVPFTHTDGIDCAGNFFFGASGWGCHLYSGTAGWRVRDNLIAFNGGFFHPSLEGSGGLLLSGPTSGNPVNKVVHNIIWRNACQCLQLWNSVPDETSGNTFANNLIDEAWAGSFGELTKGGGSDTFSNTVATNDRGTLQTGAFTTMWNAGGGTTDITGTNRFCTGSVNPTRPAEFAPSSSYNGLSAGTDQGTLSDQGLSVVTEGGKQRPRLVTMPATPHVGAFAAAASDPGTANSLHDLWELDARASVASDCYQNHAGPAPVGASPVTAAGQSAGWVIDRSPAGYRDPSQGVTANRPTWESNGLAGGTGKFFYVRGLSLIAAWEAYAVVVRAAGEQVTVLGSNDYLTDTALDTNDYSVFWDVVLSVNSSNQVIVSDGTNTASVAYTGGTGLALLHLWRTAAGAAINVEATGMSATTLTGGASVGRLIFHTMLGSPARGEWMAANARVQRVSVWNRTLTSGERTAFQATINTDHGVTL